MNYNLANRFDFETAAEFARNIARNDQPKASKILDFLIKKPERDYINLCFSYLRYADDIVDNPDLPVNQKKKFIEHQKNLISLIYKKNFPEPSGIEEACLIHFAEYSLSTNNLLLLDEVKNMIDALDMDVHRLENSGIFSNEELDHYINLMSKSVFNILYSFTLPKSGYREEFFLGSKFTTIALMIRDLEEDIDAGFINIPAEDIKHYNIDLSNLKRDKNFSICLEERIRFIFGVLYKEASLLKYLPMKFRIFTYYSLIYRMVWVVRAKIYKYNLKYISDQNFINEIKTYFLSILISINIFFKGFIFSHKKR
ncbi:MAG TPA: squalene/phytoene synthase family protein [Ignavibacteriaceae bacterium]|nr:squalene/phytoene synthase family protein [Ignavibacteriaceae bacterium]